VASLIRPYAEYLTTKVQTFSLIKRSCEREPPFEDAKWPPTLTITELTNAILAITKQLEVGFDITIPQWNGQVHPVAARVGDLLLKDALRLHPTLGLLYSATLAKKDQLSKQQLEQLTEAAIKATKFNELLRGRMSEFLTLGIRKSLPAVKFVGSEVVSELKAAARARGSSVIDKSRTRGESEQRAKGHGFENGEETEEKKKDLTISTRHRSSTPKTPSKSNKGSHSPQNDRKSPRNAENKSPSPRSKSPEPRSKSADPDDDEDDGLQVRTASPEPPDSPTPKGGVKKNKNEEKANFTC